MFIVQFSLVIICYLQLSTEVLAGPSEDARSALDSLYGRTQSSARLVSITASNVWYTYTRDLPQVVEELLRNETDKLNFVLSNLTVYADDVVGGNECFESVDSVTDVTIEPDADENRIFYNLLRGASRDISNINFQYGNMQTEWVENCVRSQDYCEGTSRAIIAEVERLLPKVRRIPYELFTEIHLLGYQVKINLEDSRTQLREQYNKAVENVISCLATKIKESTQDSPNSSAAISGDNQSISEVYADLVSVIQKTNTTANGDVVHNFVIVTLQLISDLDEGSEGIYFAYSAANDTINALFREAESLNVDLECNRGNVDRIFNSAIETTTEEVYYTSLQRLLSKAINDINDVAREIDSIAWEVAFCSGDIQCDYLLQKINSKKLEISWRIRQVKDSSVVLFHEINVLQREASARTVRDALERAETELIDLKSCVQYALQQVSSN